MQTHKIVLTWTQCSASSLEGSLVSHWHPIFYHIPKESKFSRALKSILKAYTWELFNYRQTFNRQNDSIPKHSVKDRICHPKLCPFGSRIILIWLSWETTGRWESLVIEIFFLFTLFLFSFFYWLFYLLSFQMLPLHKPLNPSLLPLWGCSLTCPPTPVSAP